ncbi:MAG TPA: type II toxin-antitoxin system VapC family toxin [Sphingomonas sp.]|nr:type II toxin-antitoxin system VapC family toxin [Sphingomonas sp.]
MRLLLDTHALIWWLAGDSSLGKAAREAIGEEGNQVLVSAASAMEISTKFRLGKLPEASLLATDLARYVANQGFIELPITLAHAARAGSLQIDHKDPFDRLLIAQSLVEQVVLVSNEVAFDGFGVDRLW